jgi:cyclopropane fatty-acyl-phospholipid synthase-like methyltransferase
MGRVTERLSALNRSGPPPDLPGAARETVRRIIRAYPHPVVRAYCWARFGILRQAFLSAIGEHLPASGRVLDIGCGFGLFSLYYAATFPDLRLHGVDLSRRRIDMARRAALELGLGNVSYEVMDARRLDLADTYDGAYMLDIVHHLEPEGVDPLLRRIHGSLPEGGRLVVKDVDTAPAAKLLFTWALDKALAPTLPVRYWSQDEVVAALQAAGFEVTTRRRLPDFLPYPHVLYVGAARR